jgi:leucyl-tRNA synthetase
MELFNSLTAAAHDERTWKQGGSLIKEGLETVIVLLLPFVPHVASELLERLGRDRLDEIPWPNYAETALEEERLLIVVQVNGRVRGKLTVPADLEQKQIESEALNDQRVRSFVDGKKVQKVVYVPRRLVNIVLEG